MQTLADEAHMHSGNTEHAVEQENEINVGCGGGAASLRQQHQAAAASRLVYVYTHI